MMIRRSALQSVGGFNPLLVGAYDDADICGRLNDAGFALRYVESAIVRHDRAPNLSRDEQHQIRDPYRTITSRAAFMLQSDHSPTYDLVSEVLHQWLQDWRNVANAQLAEGRITEQARDHFIERAIEGVQEGLAAASAPPTRAHIPDVPRSQFVPHRTAASLHGV